jgi:hypothetical protein
VSIALHRSLSNLELAAKARGASKSLVDSESSRVAKKGKKQDASLSVSPDLAQWAAANTASSIDSSRETTKTINNKKESTKKKNPSVRQLLDENQQAQARALLTEFEETLARGKTEVADILRPLQRLVELQSTINFRQLALTKSRRDFRLAWVGSDEAVCHIGTGLHKVPLARLQEVFLSFTGRGQVEFQEVIRILGPFPNVKNTLKGSSKIEKVGDDITNWQVTWESMIDGTGKEVLAGFPENSRNVGMQVLYCDDSVVIALALNEKERAQRNDPFEASGKSVMVFVKVDDLDDQLERLRVA